MAEMTIKQLVDKIAEIKQLENDMRKYRKELEEQLTNYVKETTNDKTVYLEGEKAKIKVSRTSSLKIDQKAARKFAETHPDISPKIFTISYKPKKTGFTILHELVKKDKSQKEVLEEFQSLVTEEESIRITVEEKEE